MRAEDATALAMIISELVQNAVEHGFADRDGKVDVAVTRMTLDDGEEQLTVVIADDGVGPAGGVPAGARRAGHADRHVARGGPAGPDPLVEQHARSGTRGRVVGAAATASAARRVRPAGWGGQRGRLVRSAVSRRGERGRCDA